MTRGKGNYSTVQRSSSEMDRDSTPQDRMWKVKCLCTGILPRLGMRRLYLPFAADNRVRSKRSRRKRNQTPAEYKARHPQLERCFSVICMFCFSCRTIQADPKPTLDWRTQTWWLDIKYSIPFSGRNVSPCFFFVSNPHPPSSAM